MREILFRGKDPDTGVWYQGQYIHLQKTTYCFKGDYERNPDNDIHQIVFDRMTDWGLPNHHLRADVDPDTVGQYTGVKDIKGKMIFEGDIIKWKDELWAIKYIEMYSRFAATRPGVVFSVFPYHLGEVVGNIHENPELMEKCHG